MPCVLNKRFMGQIRQTLDGMYHVSCGGRYWVVSDPDEAQQLLEEMEDEWVNGPKPILRPKLLYQDDEDRPPMDMMELAKYGRRP